MHAAVRRALPRRHRTAERAVADGLPAARVHPRAAQLRPLAPRLQPPARHPPHRRARRARQGTRPPSLPEAADQLPRGLRDHLRPREPDGPAALGRAQLLGPCQGQDRQQLSAAVPRAMPRRGDRDAPPTARVALRGLAGHPRREPRLPAPLCRRARLALAERGSHALQPPRRHNAVHPRLPEQAARQDRQVHRRPQQECRRRLPRRGRRVHPRLRLRARFGRESQARVEGRAAALQRQLVGPPARVGRAAQVQRQRARGRAPAWANR